MSDTYKKYLYDSDICLTKAVYIYYHLSDAIRNYWIHSDKWSKYLPLPFHQFRNNYHHHNTYSSHPYTPPENLP